MNKDAVLEFNKRCAKKLGWVNKGMVNLELWVSDKFPSGIATPDLKFHSDWDWIHLIAVSLKDIHNPYENSNTTFLTLRREVQYRIGISDKEGAIQALNDFLIWYENNLKINQK